MSADSAKKILLSGNEAIGEGALQAGCRFYAGYPITPQNELIAYMARRMPEVGGTFIQAESELAAINMVFGASVAGARAMTSSSSPGISLKQEGISYMAACELPGLIVNVMRGGPGLGNIAPSQADYFQATKGGGHGDYHMIVLAPASVQEALALVGCAFDLADKYSTPAMLLADGLLGQMMEPVDLNGSQAAPRLRSGRAGHRPQATKDWALTGCEGRKPRVILSLRLKEGELEAHNNKLQAKYRKIEESEVLCETIDADDAELILVAYGTASRIAKQAMGELRKKGFKVGLIRPISLWPFPKGLIQRTAEKAGAFLVVEMSAGQMVEDVRLALEGRRPVRFYGRTGGGLPMVKEIVDIATEITSQMRPELRRAK